MKLYISSLLILLTQVSCQADAKKIKTTMEKPYLVSAESKSKVSAAELKESFGPAAAFIKNRYTAYRLTYNTINIDGKGIVASGLCLHRI